MTPLLLPAIFAVSLTGCAQLGDTRATDGSAVYRLKSSDCEVEIVSGRAFAGGTLDIGQECSVHAQIDAVDGLQALELAKRILGGIGE